MKTFFSNSSKRTALVAMIVAFFILALAVHSGYVQGKASIRPTANTNPVVGATVVLSNTLAGPGYKVIATAMTDAKGNFKLTSSNAYIYVGGYNISFTPAGGAPATPLQVWATFGSANGLTVNNINGGRPIGSTGSVLYNGTTGAGNPVLFTSGKPLRVVLSANIQSISGTLKD